MITAAKSSFAQFFSHLLTTDPQVFLPLTYAEDTELELFRKCPDQVQICFKENNYCRFGILESLRRKGYLIEVKETLRVVHYKLNPKHNQT